MLVQNTLIKLDSGYDGITYHNWQMDEWMDGFNYENIHLPEEAKGKIFPQSHIFIIVIAWSFMM